MSKDRDEFSNRLARANKVTHEKTSIREITGEDKLADNSQGKKAPAKSPSYRGLSIYVDNDLWDWVKRESFYKEESKSSIVVRILEKYARSHPNN